VFAARGILLPKVVVCGETSKTVAPGFAGKMLILVEVVSTI
jgi:hypothetical protein